MEQRSNPDVRHAGSAVACSPWLCTAPLSPPGRGVAAGAAAALILLAGCDTLSFRRLDFDNTEAGSGDVTVTQH